MSYTPPAKIFRATAVLILPVVFGTISLFGCRNAPPDAGSDSLSVLTTVEPIAFFLTEIADGHIAVETLVPAGKEPETFAPTLRTVQRFAACSVYFRVGLACEEPLLARLTTMNSRLKIVDLRDSIPESFHAPAGCGHEGGHEGGEGDDTHEAPTDGSAPEHAENHTADHDHAPSGCGDGGLDPHLWMSPAVMKGAVRTMTESLASMAPEHRSEFEQNRDDLIRRLEELERQISERLEGRTNRNIYVFHPAYGYFCEQFGLQQRAMEEGGRTPSPKDLADWIARIGAERVGTIIAQPEFGESYFRALAESVSVNIEIHSPLLPDYFANLGRLTDLICAEELEKGEKSPP